MKLLELRVDEDFRNLLPELSDDEYQGLEDDIRKQGVLSPIITWHGYIADGHNRFSICKALGVEEIETKELQKDSKSDVMAWIIKHQFARRNLTKSQTVKAWEKVRLQYAEEAKERQKEGRNQYSPVVNLPEGSTGRTSEKIAEQIGVSEKHYRDMVKVVNEGTPEQIKRMDKGGNGNGVSRLVREIVDKQRGIPEGYSKCSVCGEIKPVNEFLSDRRMCRDCYKGEGHAQSISKAIHHLKDITRESTATEDGTVDEIIAIFDTFKNAVMSVLSSRPYQKKQVKDALNNFIESIKELKGTL